MRHSSSTSTSLRACSNGMVLQRVEVEELLARREVDGLELGVRALAGKRSLDTRLGEFAAQRDVEQAQRRILLQLGALVGEVPDIAAPLLDRDVADLRSLAEEDLGRTAAVAGLGVIFRDVFVEVVEAGVLAGDDQGVGKNAVPAFVGA